MKYISTRGQDGPLSFEEALLNGLARDGGLYLPVEWPAFSKARYFFKISNRQFKFE